MDNSTRRLIYTPKHHIPIGEAIILSDGQFAIRMKKAHEITEETITLNTIILLITKETRDQNAGSPSEASASQ